MSTPPRPTVFRHAAALLFVCAVWIGVCPVYAASSAAVQFDVPADSAARSLKIFAHQSGREVIVSADHDGLIQTKAVKGEMTPAMALAVMLAGTGLVADPHEKTGAYAVRRDNKAKKNDQRAAQKTPSDRPTSPGKPQATKILQKL